MTAPIPRDMPDLPAIPRRPALLPSPVPATAVMAPVRRPLTAAFRLLIALAAAAGVTIDLLLDSPARVLSDFTVQSAVLLAPVLAFSARRAWTARRPLPGVLTGAALLYVVTAALVHHLLLTNAASPSTPTTNAVLPDWAAPLADHTLHTAVPLAAVLDWLLLTTPGRLHLRQAGTWLLYPLAYLVFSLARGELPFPGTPPRYLYPFLDVAQHGYKSVLGNALLLGLSIYALAIVLVAVDRTRPDPTRQCWKTGFRLQPPVG